MIEQRDENVAKETKCDWMQEQRGVRTLRESKNMILYERSGAGECRGCDKAEKMRSDARIGNCRNTESKCTENAIVCENSSERLLRKSIDRENAYLCEKNRAPEC